MKRIQDAPKELQNLFKIELEKWPMPPDRDTEHAFKLAVEYFFLKGFDVAIATGGLSQKPMRTIAKLYVSRQDPIMALSSDGHGYEFVSESGTWRNLPDLPQD